MKELEDKKWFPAFLRKHQMEYISFIATVFKIYLPLRPKLLDHLNITASKEWTDVCSGKGGPVLSLDIDHPVLLTDLYPTQPNDKHNPLILYSEKEVDILRDEIPGNGLISMFNAFHHFDDFEKGIILQKAKKDLRPIFIAEILQPDLICLLRVIITTTVGHWLCVPFMKPFSFQRLLFTYLLPLHTLTIMIDGIISVFKSGSKKYYQEMADRYSTKSYQFNFETIPSFSSTIYLLKGRAVKN